MDCLVTGGAGFIGSNLVDALLARGDRVTVIDNLSTGKRENLAGALEQRRDAGGGRRARRRDASRRSSPPCDPRWCSISRPRSTSASRSPTRRPTRDRTCWGRSRCWRRPARTGARRLVNTSTGGGLYGDADLLPTPEDLRSGRWRPTARASYAAEGYCGLYTRLHGLSTVSLRYGNVYGPRQDVHGEAGVVAIFCGHVLDGRTPTVFGDGHQTRDWVDVSDVVRANLLAADCDLTGPINIGHGQETSVLDLSTRCATSPTARCPSRSSSRSGRARSGAAAWTSAAPGASCAGSRRCSCATDCGRSWPGLTTPRTAAQPGHVAAACRKSPPPRRVSSAAETSEIGSDAA